VAGYIHIDGARVLYELNELELAGQHLGEGIKLCQRLADGRAEKIGHCLLARVQLASGDFAGAVDSIRNAKQADPSPEILFDLRGGEYPKIRLWLKDNKLKEAEAWLDERGANADNVSHFKTKLTYTMHARVLIALGQEHPSGTHLKDALALLEELVELAESNGWGNKVIEILALQALAFQAGGESALAMTKLKRALMLAEPEGFIRTFVDEGPPMVCLLYEALSRGIAPNYVQRLLAVFEDATKDRGQFKGAVQPFVVRPPAPTPNRAQGLVEPLSERELEVLHLLAEGLTNREIASRLFLSLNTVKAHCRSIYGKLCVGSRTQAVARARALGVLPFT
jgi:LuxR family maltose regulon positive regulatory protein